MATAASDTSLRLRPFARADGDALAVLHREAIRRSGTAYYSMAELESWATGLSAVLYAQAIEAGETIDVAVDELDAPIAFCSRLAEGVAGLYVHPDWQGRGAGAALLRLAEDALVQDGLTRLKLDASLPAVSFYERRGYKSVEERTFKSRGGLEMACERMIKQMDEAR